MMMAVGILFVLLLFPLQKANGQTPPPVIKQVLEGLSTNIDILCDLDRQLHPQYWEIRGRVYDLYSIPEVFEVRGHEAIRLPNVDRRMDGWTFRCFTIVDETRLMLGLETRLVVVPNAMDPEGPPDDPNLLQSSLLGRLVLHYQKLQLGLEETTLSWLYTARSSSSCNAFSFRVNVYTREEIFEAESQNSLREIQFHETTARGITIPSHFFKNQANIAHFFRVSALQNGSASSIACADAAYFNNFTAIDNNGELYVDRLSSKFYIPEDIRSDIESIQLIWSKDNNTQCVCPPVEEQMRLCACNAENMNRNFITISNNTVTVFNLTQDMDERELRLYFVLSVSRGCNLACNLRSINSIFIIPDDPLPPQPPNITDTGMAICLHIPDLIHRSPEVYEVNLTDSTGSQTRLSGVYNTSQCLTITSDLYPTVCGPFQVSVAAVNSVGRNVTQQTLLRDNQPMPCECFREKERFSLVTTTSSTAANLTLMCVDKLFVTTLTVTQTKNNLRMPRSIAATCDVMTTVDSLMPSTNYSVSIVYRDTMCLLDHFRTNRAARDATVTPVIFLLFFFLFL